MWWWRETFRVGLKTTKWETGRKTKKRKRKKKKQQQKIRKRRFAVNDTDTWPVTQTPRSRDFTPASISLLPLTSNRDSVEIWDAFYVPTFVKSTSQKVTKILKTVGISSTRQSQRWWGQDRIHINHSKLSWMNMWHSEHQTSKHSNEESEQNFTNCPADFIMNFPYFDNHWLNKTYWQDQTIFSVLFSCLLLVWIKKHSIVYSNWMVFIILVSDRLFFGQFDITRNQANDFNAIVYIVEGICTSARNSLGRSRNPQEFPWVCVHMCIIHFRPT